MSTLDTLPINDQVLVKEFVRTRNKTKAYQAAHPSVQPNSARTLAPRRFANVRVQQAVKEALSLESLQDDLRWCREEAKKQGDLREYRGSVMDLAKLGGLLVDKHEDVTKKQPDLTPEELEQELIKRGLLNQNVS